MYFSPFIMQTLISLLLFHLQDTCTAKDHSVQMKLRGQRRRHVDSPLDDAFLSSDNHPTAEKISKYELTTTPSSSRDILVGRSGPGPGPIQQSWLVGQDPVDTLLLTLCTTNTDESSDQHSLIPPSAKFQRRQTGVVVPKNACPPEWVITQPPGPGQQQQNVKLDVQGQGQGQGSKKKKIPDGTRLPGPAAAEGAEEQKVTPYPNALELYRLDTFGRAGESNSICDGFVGQSIPMCAPSSLKIPVSPPNILAPSRFCKC